MKLENSFLKSMSTRWKQSKGIILCMACLLLALSMVVFVCNQSKAEKSKHSESNGAYSTLNYTDWRNRENVASNTLAIYNDVTNLSSDYVRPMKVYNFSLTSDDLLYESKRNNEEKGFFSAYSITGNFRSKHDQIWDPHPEYILTAFGQRLHIILRQDNSFIAPSTFSVIRVSGQRTEVQDDERYYLGCYYKGYVQGDNQSSVAVSLCNGMTGHIKTSFGSLLIQPENISSNTENSILHKVWIHSKRHIRSLVLDNFKTNIMEEHFTKLLRKKRNYVDNHLFTMEVLVAVDKTMSEFHNGDLKSYILTLISIVSNIFSDASIGNSIYISVPNILILKDDIIKSRTTKSISASQLLKHFCSFLKEKGIRYDTAIMLTRDQICRNERETKCDTLGLAELGTVCKRYSCSIVQDNGLPAAFTIAHELGHILNMPHDDDTRCDNFKPHGKKTLHIMSSRMSDDIHPWSWSDCSRHYVSEFLEKEDTTCLEDTPEMTVPNFNTKLPGELYSLDKQCRLIHGNHSKYCFMEGECTRLWCRAEKNVSDCMSSNLPWADGTPCKSTKYWCQKGKCISRGGTKRQVINGGWGPWSIFAPCSMTCGGGVQESQRECNNPFPQNGGKYCGGSRKKYRSCNTYNCPPGSLDSREQQCYDMNGNNFGLKDINSSVVWIPKYGLTGKDKCKLYCRWESTTSYFQLSDKVKDGTACSFDSFDKCVNGICRPAGCDNELNSIATLDKCGVCEGRNNTCEIFSANFYRSDLSNRNQSLYYYVTTIPKGSSNIVITQPGYHTQNYIVLRNANGKNLLNGDRIIQTQANVFFYAGLSFEYNGSTSQIERVNTTYSRKLQKDLIVEIISLSVETIKNDSILLSYSYTTDKPSYVSDVELFQWELTDWSQCDALCQGNSFQIADCIKVDSRLKVSPPFCDSTTKPGAQYRTCNTDCYITLNITNISECSATCGIPGKREKEFYCIQTYYKTNRSNIVNLSYCEPKFKINFTEDCREGCWNYTAWSSCSLTCGNGQQVRSVACFLNSTQVDDSLCNSKSLSSYTDKTRPCSLKPCVDWSTYGNKVHHQWVVEEWGACDDNCAKIRKVECYPGDVCPMDKKPIERKKCCSIKYIATWSPCSVECGVGTRKKEFYCAMVYKSEQKSSRRKRLPVDSNFCNKLKVPTPKRSKKTCKVSCKWVAENWSACASDCRNGFQIRAVNCETIHGRQISSKYCEFSRKPLMKKMCSHCFRREYKITKCNCEGFRRRRLVCSDAYQKRIPCPNKLKVLKEKCRIPGDCLPKSCSDIKRSNKRYYDQEYTIFVQQKRIQIYCHNMKGKPTEYVTLDPTENYSVYYSNKTKYPDLCPPESRAMEYNDFSIKYGRTHFRKVGINITSLQVMENDFTFADSVGNPQPFGSAGDCYNRNGDCPQGDFSMNFNMTGLIIKSGTRWDMLGNNIAMKFSNESATSRSAFCGGYCGRCVISSNTGLILAVQK